MYRSFFAHDANDYFGQKEKSKADIQYVKNALVLWIKCFYAEHNGTQDDDNADNGLKGFAVSKLMCETIHGEIISVSGNLWGASII
jgi:hypothetical protein